MKKLLLLTAFLSVFSAFHVEEANAQETFLGDVKWFGFNFCPRGYMEANGQLVNISSNAALFSLYGTMYGGDGRTTFGIPDLRGRSLVGVGDGPGLSPKTQGQKGGTETETLNTSQIPSHSHTANAVTEGASKDDPTGSYIAKSGSFRAGGTETALKAETIGNAGGGSSHNNRPPFLVLKPCVATVGVFPSRS
jgi:microcystin-dependent protein